MTSGPLPDNPAEQLGSRRAADVIAQATSALPGGAGKDALQLSLFGTKHFAAGPRLRGLSLFRGKNLTPVSEIGPDRLRTAVKRVGEYLAKNQDQEGCYRVGGQQVQMRDQFGHALVEVDQSLGHLARMRGGVA